MRKIFTICVAVFFFGCNDPEISSKHYPYVVMKDVKTSNDGVEFVAEFMDLGDSPITRYGFLWWQGPSMDSTDFYFTEIESNPVAGPFSVNITSDLEKGLRYQVRPFAQNQNSIVLGDVMSFESKGTNPPKLQDFFPKRGKSGDVITISGSNFSLSKTRVEVLLGTDKGILISTDVNEIKFKLPENLSKSGEVPLIVKSGDAILQAEEPFLVEGHQIEDFNPKTGIIGETEIVITGNNFLGTGNKIRFGSYEAIVLEESENEITVRLPYEMRVGVVPVEVEINGQTAIADGVFTVKSRWAKLADFPGTPRLDAFSTVVGDFLYVIGGSTDVYSDEVWRYDFANDSWMRLPNFPGGGRSGGVGFSIGNTIYYGLGVGSTKDFWSYNTITGQWTASYDLGGVQNPISTSIDGIGYLIGSYGEIYSFTEQTGWSYNGRLFFNISTYYDDYFEVAGDPYILDMIINGNTGERTYNVYKVNRSNPIVWEFICNVPFTHKMYSAISFGLNTDFAYIGEGAVEFEEREFIRLNVSTNEWTRIENFQGALLVRSAISFSHNNKGYTAFGLVCSPVSGDCHSSNELWVYDPSIQ